MNVHRINSETLLEFIARVGVVNADNVQQRFGWDNRRAREELQRLAAAGQLVQSGRHANYDYGGARLEWRLP
jgi:hypothetical protein